MISEKIKKQIEDLQIDEDMKKLMLRILEEEDKGIYKFKDLYDKLVNEYIEKEEEKGDNND